MPQNNIKKKETTTSKSRNEIRLVDVPDSLFKKIGLNAASMFRSNGNEVLAFLKKNYK